MIKVEVIENFHLGRYSELKNVVRKTGGNDNYLYIGDTFECTEYMAKYLTNEIKNPGNRAFVKVIEIIPEKDNKIIEKKEDPKITRKTSGRRRKTIAKRD